MLYGVYLKKRKRYLNWFGNWYETTDKPTFKWTEEEANEIVKGLKRCYVYDALPISENGVEVHKVECKPKKQTPLKNLFSLNINLLRK
jgi:hypothetical protein